MAYNRISGVKKGTEGPRSFDNVDEERVAGFETMNNNNNNNNTSKTDANPSDKTAKRFPPEGTVRSSVTQCLLKGDRVLAFTSENVGWNSFLSKSRKDCKFVTGAVVLKKEWKECSLMLYIRWENGKFEKLARGSEHVAYGDRIFVLDRECVGPGSKVFLAGYPTWEGTVINKRYLATARDTQDHQIIFEDIDTRSLVRQSHGHAFKSNKILYQGWLGLTSDYRSRLYLTSLSETELEGTSFSIVLDGEQSKDFVVGQHLNLGFRLLKAADFSGELGTNWFVNFFRYYNTTAVITAIEIEELLVYWIGKMNNPVAELNPYDLADAPDQIICRDDLINVHYLVGDKNAWMSSSSLWKYKSVSDHNVKSISLITKEKWISKWLKKVDWDRWESTPLEEVQEKQEYLNHERTLEILYTRSVFDVLWSDDSITTVDAGDVIPIHAGSAWSDLIRLHKGTIVRNRLNQEEKEVYGVIKELLDKQTALVKWINPALSKSNGEPLIKESAVSMYDLDEISEYEFVSRVNQSPLVSSTIGLFKVGVIHDINPESGLVRIKLPNGQEVNSWPHNLVHFKCDIILCPIEGRWVSWYEHVIPPAGVLQVTPESKDDANLMNEAFLDESISVDIPVASLPPKKKLEGIIDVPNDNIFVLEDMLPRLRETQFRRTVETEIIEMENSLPDGIWVEYYMNRGDIMSAVLTGPENSIFEDFIFVFDILLLEDFPRSEPHINFRSMGITILPGHFCKSGAVFLPEETRLTEKDYTFSYTLNLLLEIIDFMGLPLEIIQLRGNKSLINANNEDPDELYKFVLLNVLDYAIALLRNPPKNWHTVILQHYVKALPRIFMKHSSGKLQMKPVLVTVTDEKGDFPEPVADPLQMVSIPWSETYAESVKARMDQLQKIFSSIKTN